MICTPWPCPRDGELKAPGFPPTIKHFHVPTPSRMEGIPPESGTQEAFCRVGQNESEVATRALQAKISLTQQISDHQFRIHIISSSSSSFLPVELGLGKMRTGCRRRNQRSCSTRDLSLIHPHPGNGSSGRGGSAAANQGDNSNLHNLAAGQNGS